MMNGTSTHFVLSTGSGSGGGYSRGRNDHQSNNDDSGRGGSNRSRDDYQNNDDKGSSGHSRSRNDNRDNNDDNGGGGGYNRSRNDYHNNGGGGSGGSGGDDSRMETQRDTIFIQSLPRNVTTDELRDVFSQIGIIKVRYYF
jgi:RNA recognition motif-containing protein